MNISIITLFCMISFTYALTACKSSSSSVPKDAGADATGDAAPIEGPKLIVCSVAGPGCDFVGGDGLQNAVDSVKEGVETTIVVKAGEYSRQTFSEYLGTTGHPPNVETGEARKGMFVISGKRITLKSDVGARLDGASSANMTGLAITGNAQVTLDHLWVSGFKRDDVTCFAGSNPCSAGQGIYVGGAAKVVIADARLEGQSVGLAARDTSTVEIRRSIVATNGIGLFVQDSANVLAIGCKLDGNKSSDGISGFGISVFGTSYLTVQNSIFTRNDNAGIYAADTPNVRVINNTFDGNNGTAIDMFSCDGTAQGGTNSNPSFTITNNIFSNTKATPGSFGSGIFGYCTYESGKLSNDSISYNLFFNNPGQLAGGCSVVEVVCNTQNELNVDPLYVGYNAADPSKSDFHLSTGSPAANTGDPAIPNKNGTPSDRGAYGGPNACSLDSTLTGC